MFFYGFILLRFQIAVCFVVLIFLICLTFFLIHLLLFDSNDGEGLKSNKMKRNAPNSAFCEVGETALFFCPFVGWKDIANILPIPCFPG